MGKDGAQRERQKGEAMTGPGAKNVKSVHKYRGPYHITTVTGPLTPAVPVAMDTSIRTLPPPYPILWPFIQALDLTS